MNKKLFSILTAASMAVSMAGTSAVSAFAADEENGVLRGDADGNGIIDLEDMNLCQNYVLGCITDDEIDLEAADANNDGYIDSADAACILDYTINAMVGLEPEMRDFYGEDYVGYLPETCPSFNGSKLEIGPDGVGCTVYIPFSIEVFEQENYTNAIDLTFSTQDNIRLLGISTEDIDGAENLYVGYSVNEDENVLKVSLLGRENDFYGTLNGDTTFNIIAEIVDYPTEETGYGLTWDEDGNNVYYSYISVSGKAGNYYCEPYTFDSEEYGATESMILFPGYDLENYVTPEYPTEGETEDITDEPDYPDYPEDPEYPDYPETIYNGYLDMEVDTSGALDDGTFAAGSIVPVNIYIRPDSGSEVPLELSFEIDDYFENCGLPVYSVSSCDFRIETSFDTEGPYGIVSFSTLEDNYIYDTWQYCLESGEPFATINFYVPDSDYIIERPMFANITSRYEGGELMFGEVGYTTATDIVTRNDNFYDDPEHNQYPRIDHEIVLETPYKTLYAMGEEFRNDDIDVFEYYKVYDEDGNVVLTSSGFVWNEDLIINTDDVNTYAPGTYDVVVERNLEVWLPSGETLNSGRNACFTIEVVDAQATIFIENVPDKVKYQIGEELEFGGLEISGQFIYINADGEEIDETFAVDGCLLDTTEVDMSTPGWYPVTVISNRDYETDRGIIPNVESKAVYFIEVVDPEEELPETGYSRLYDVAAAVAAVMTLAGGAVYVCTRRKDEE